MDVRKRKPDTSVQFWYFMLDSDQKSRCAGFEATEVFVINTLLDPHLRNLSDQEIGNKFILKNKLHTKSYILSPSHGFEKRSIKLLSRSRVFGLKIIRIGSYVDHVTLLSAKLFIHGKVINKDNTYLSRFSFIWHFQ